MNAWLSFASLWLMDMAVLATVLLAAALALRLIMRDAKSRVLLAWGTWLGILVAASVTLLPGWPRYNWSAIARLLNNEPATVAIGSDAELSAMEVSPIFLSPAMQPGNDQTLAVSAPRDLQWRELAVLAWLAGGLAGMAWIALGCWQARKLLRRSQTAPRWIADEFAQITAPRRPRPGVRTSAQLNSAVALRARLPVIVLPRESAIPANAPAVRAALAHEWAHIRHGDLWLLALERLLLPLLALHPLFWWLRRSTRLDQELLADAAAAGDKPVEYAEALVAWAKSSSPPPASLAALAFWDRPSNLTRRVNMILNKPRKPVTWFSRVLNVTAFACLLVLVGGLSIITLQPLAAEDEPKQRVPAPVVEHPIAPLPASFPATSASPTIEFVCTLIEVDPAELAQALSGGERPPLPSPAIELGIQTMAEWSAVSARLAARPNTNVVSNPRLRTLNNRHASIQMGSQPKGRSEIIGLKIVLHPELLPKIGNEQQLLLSIGFERTAFDDSPVESGKLPSTTTRKLQTKVAVPLGKIVVVADPSNRSAGAQRPLLLVIEPRIVAPGNEEQETAKVVDPSQPGGNVQQRLRELQSQLDRLASEPPASRESTGVREAMLRLQREIAELIEDPNLMPAMTEDGVLRLTNTYHLRETDPIQLKEALKKRIDEQNIRGVVMGTERTSRFVPGDSRPFKSLTISAPLDQADAIRRLVLELAPEIRAAASKQGLNEPHPREAPSVPRDAQSTVLTTPANPPRITNHDSTQQKLLELDLRESEINLQSTQAEHERYAEMHRKNPGAISESEIRQSRLKVELAQIQVERMKVRLDAHRAANPPATPAAPRR